MARGRFISKAIVRDKAIASLSSDTSRMLFMYAVAHLDVEGRISGDPVMLTQLLGVRLAHITPDVVEECLDEWQESGLVKWYEAEGDLWLEFSGFSKHQLGLRKDKEAPSSVPTPDSGQTYSVSGTVEVRSNSGVTPPLKEKKKKKEKRRLEGKPPDLVRTDSGATPTLHVRIQKSMEEALGCQFPNYGKEGAMIKKMIAMATELGDPEEVTLDVLSTFQYLKENGSSFWSSQPYLPSAIVPLWPRILAEKESRERPEKTEDVIGNIIGGAVEEAWK